MTQYATLTNAHHRFLQALFPGDGCLIEPEARAAFGADASRRSATPDAVVRPEGEEQVSELLRWAHAERVPIYARGRATSQVGGAVPVQGGVAVSFLRMNRILDIWVEDFVAVVQPGVVTADLQNVLEAHKLFYPPDPASVGFSTIGGNVATCAGGMRALKYGVTRDFLLGMHAVVPGGEVLRLGGRCHKDVAGLDLTRTLAGSGGHLGLFTELTLKVLPLPETTASALAGFDSVEKALYAARALFRSGSLPAALEFMDGTTLEALAHVRQESWLHQCGGALLMRLDGSRAAVEADLANLRQVLDGCDPVFLESAMGKDQDGLWEIRRMISPALYQLAPDKCGEDVAVPRGRIQEAVRGLEQLGRRHGLRTACFGHLGDGNLHANILYDAAKPNQSAAVQFVKQGLFDLTLSLGGTITGEHGIGLTKKAMLDKQFGDPELSVMRGLKKLFDPNHILNPGKEW